MKQPIKIQDISFLKLKVSLLERFYPLSLENSFLNPQRLLFKGLPVMESILNTDRQKFIFDWRFFFCVLVWHGKFFSHWFNPIRSWRLSNKNWTLLDQWKLNLKKIPLNHTSSFSNHPPCYSKDALHKIKGDVAAVFSKSSRSKRKKGEFHSYFRFRVSKPIEY